MVLDILLVILGRQRSTGFLYKRIDKFTLVIQTCVSIWLKIQINIFNKKLLHLMQGKNIKLFRFF